MAGFSVRLHVLKHAVPKYRFFSALAKPFVIVQLVEVLRVKQSAIAKVHVPIIGPTKCGHHG